ncbi:MAG: hypothetical protein D6705_09545 [Deltaproteobacteria bacterium]|nr:MAG: hypothetical protein D6705_09545 [Deltaproteobacteria bacterium]
MTPDDPIPCRFLSTKGRVIHGRTAPCLRRTSPSSHYTCLRTQTVLGPDDGLCVPEACTPARPCYRPDTPCGASVS